MNWFLYALAAWNILGALTVVATVGKPRGPITPGLAVILVAINLGIAAGLVVGAVHSG